MKFVLSEVGNIRQEFRGVLVHGLAGNDPAHVSPQTAVLRGVGIAFFVGVLMMDAMGGDPGDGTAFESERAAHRQKVFHPNRSLVAAMGKQAMVAHADAQAPGDAIEDDRYGKRFPRKQKQSGDSADVEQKHEGSGGPIQRLLKSAIFFA
jgi:hypothetical protein